MTTKSKTNQPKAGQPRAEKSTKKSKKEKKPAKRAPKPSLKEKEKKEINKEELSRLSDKTQTSKLKEAKEKKYYEAVGRRKCSVARVRLFTASPLQSALEGNLIINNKSYKEFFSVLELQKIVEVPLVCLKSLNRFRATIKVRGGGIRGQAEAVRHGISRALVLFDANFRKKLKKAGYLTRDQRQKERKKFGLKKARRAPQWTKR